MTETVNQLPPYPPHSVGERAALAAYAVLRAHDLIKAGDWTIPNEIGVEAQAAWDRLNPIYPGVQPWIPVQRPSLPSPAVFPGVQPWIPVQPGQPVVVQPWIPTQPSTFPSTQPSMFPWVQPWPFPIHFGSLSQVTCTKCGMKWEGAMGYVCTDSHCPVQSKVTC